MKLRAGAELVENAIHEMLAFYAYPPKHWLKLKTNNPRFRRRSYSALMLVAAQLRHVSATTWCIRKHMNMKLLEEMNKDIACSAA